METAENSGYIFSQRGHSIDTAEEYFKFLLQTGIVSEIDLEIGGVTNPLLDETQNPEKEGDILRMKYFLIYTKFNIRSDI